MTRIGFWRSTVINIFVANIRYGFGISSEEKIAYQKLAAKLNEIQTQIIVLAKK